jgi:hypothetical protein
MVCFQTKNPSLGKFWTVLQWKILVYFFDHLIYFTAIENILGPFSIFCGRVVFFPSFGILYQEKSGNPAAVRNSTLFSEMVQPTVGARC